MRTRIDRSGFPIWKDTIVAAGNGLPVLARGQAEPAFGDAFIAHPHTGGYCLGRDVVLISEGKDLPNPCSRRRRWDRFGCFGRQPPALMVWVQVPAHFGQASWPVGVAQRQ